MQSLLAFIPEDRRLALAENQELPDRTTGSVLFADISGFTHLTAVLAGEQGIQRGAEEVLNQINPVYEAIIAELHRYGGSVLGFAGDSITCWLDGDQGHRGVACAMAMQRAMQPFATVLTPAGTPVTLAIKVAVATGPVRRFIVGDPDIQLIDVLAGRTLDHVAAAERLANKGEVIVGEELVRKTGELCEVVEWRKEARGASFAIIGTLREEPEPRPHPALTSLAIDEEQARHWVLPPIYSRLKSGEKFLAELRPTTALFLKFTGIDYDNDDEAESKLDSYIRWLQNTVRQQDGFLTQLTIGDKGSYAYFTFGAPVAHDDDSLRAVTAALDFRELPDYLDFIGDVRIGISQGRVWTGEYGAVLRHTYGAMGNEVNMAARLMSAAEPNQILVRRRVADEALQMFRFNQLGLRPVKVGAEEVDIPVAELIGRQEGQSTQFLSYDLPLVGREEELNRLERILDGVLAGQGDVVSIIGPTGIGKSHLLAEFQQRARANGFQVATGSAQRIFHDTTYYPWQQIIRQLFGLNPAFAMQGDAQFAMAQIDSLEQALLQMNLDWQIRLPLLGDLLGWPIPDNPTTAAFDPKQRRDSLFAFVIEIVRDWSRLQPLLLAFENAHWMDEPSQELLEVVTKAVTDVPLLVAVATRPLTETSESPPAVTALQVLSRHHVLRLEELGPAGIQALIESVLGGATSLLARLLIEAKGRGNPFFTRALVDSLRESDQLVRENGVWVLSEDMIDVMRKANALIQEDGTWTLAKSADLASVSLGIPDSVHGIILARIDRLPDSHKPTIKVASVVGYSFELGLVAQVHPSHLVPDEILAQAITLEQRDFIIQDWDVGIAASTESFKFREQATHEVSYGTLLFTQRRELHKSLAVVLEQRSPEVIDEIAYHAYLGEDWERTLRYHLIAGSQDKRLFANLQSIEHYRKALTGAEHLPADETMAQRLQINTDLGELLGTVGQYDQAREHLNTALQLAKEASNLEAQAQACRWLARSHELQGAYEPALEWTNKGLTILGDRLTPSALELRLISGLIFLRMGDLERAGQQALASLLAAGELHELSIVARSHNLLGIIDRSRGLLSTAARHFEESLTLYREAGNLHGQALAENSLANVYFDMGQWTRADQNYRQAGQIFSQLGNVYNRAMVENNLGGIALNQGRLDDAIHFYQSALGSLERIGGSIWIMGALHLNLGATHIRRQEAVTGLDHLQTSRELFDRAKNRDLLPELHRRLAEGYLALGNLEAANDAAQQSMALARDLAVLGEQGLASETMGRIAAAKGQPEASEANLQQAIELLEKVGDDYGLACAQLSLAEVYDRSKQFRRRDELLDQCVPVFTRLGATIEIARAQPLLEASPA